METDKTIRKETPMARGLLDYFPLALAEVARVSYVANEQHNPGQPMHWAKEKSTDHADCIIRHLVDRGTEDTDGLLHSAKVAWRALALLETELEAGVPVASGSSTAPASIPAIRTACGVFGCKIHALTHNRIGAPSGHANQSLGTI
jgi:hypothetical protein